MNFQKELSQILQLERFVGSAFSRRAFMATSVKVSVVSVALLSLAGSFAHIASLVEETKVVEGYRKLRSQDALLFGALVPVILTDVRTDKSLSVFLHSLDDMFATASDGTLGNIRNLVDLLTLSVTRPAMTGTIANWPELSLEERDTILNSWRKSSFELPALAYAVTVRLVCMAWFGVAENQSGAGYPGPPTKLPQEPV